MIRMDKYEGKHKDKVKDEIFSVVIVGGVLSIIPITLSLLPLFL